MLPVPMLLTVETLSAWILCEDRVQWPTWLAQDRHVLCTRKKAVLL